MIASNEKLLLELIKVALGKSNECVLPNALDWNALFDLSMKQCVPALVLDGLSMCLKKEGTAQTVDVFGQKNKLCKFKWMGVVLQMEKLYAFHERVIADLADFYEKAGFRMMLLKGYGLSKYWPEPKHRPVGDVDIYLLEKEGMKQDGDLPVWKRADAILQDVLNIKPDNSHHHHSVFTYKGVMVENHYDFVNVNSHRSNRWIEKEFKSLAASEHGVYAFKNGVEVFLPSDLLNVLFVARHNACHFAAEGMNLRQVLDWALLVEKCGDGVDWQRFWTMCVKMGMENFVLCMTEICVERLGFSREIFRVPLCFADFSEKNGDLIEGVMEDIFHPYKPKSKKGFAYIMSRFDLWKKNLWKHNMVYSDGVISTFFVQLLSHLMKPATILGN